MPQINIQDFLTELTNKKSHISRERRDQCLHLAEVINANKAKLDSHAREIIIAHLRIGAQSKNPFRATISNCLLFSLEGDKRALGQALKTSLKEEASVEDHIADLNALFSMMFHNHEGKAVISDTVTPEAIQGKWRRALRQLESELDADGVEIAVSSQNKGRVVVLIQQLLSLGHAPSRDAFEFCRKLIKDYGKEVLLVNTLEFSPARRGTLVPAFVPSVMTEYAGHKNMAYEDVVISAYQSPKNDFSQETVKEIIQVINNFGPEQILVVGTRSLIADLYADKIFSFTYPTTTNVPLVERGYFMMWKDPRPSEIEAMKKCGVLDRYLFSMHPGFEPPVRQREYTRPDFDLPESSFIYAVVGNRLYQDVNEEFLDFMEEVCAHPRAHFFLIGVFDEFEDVVYQRPKLIGRVTSAGYQSDIMAVLDLCDGYVNPIRAGGGSAIIYAMAAGLAPLSTNFGDAHEAVKDFPALENYPQMADRAKSLITDKELFGTYCQKAKTCAEQLTNRDQLLAEIEKAFKGYQSGQLAAVS